MSDKIIACILDVAGVQTYIFSSNKLKENLGASFIVKNIYKNFLSCIIKKHFDLDEFDIDFWESMSETRDNTSEDDQKINLFSKYDGIDICYIGGGNALLFFKTLPDFSSVIKKFTTSLLLYVPGLHVDIAYIETNSKDVKNNFRKIRDKLYAQLDSNKNNYPPNVTLSRHGFTASCPRTGLSGENIMVNKEGKNEILSSVCTAKINSAKSQAFKKEFDNILEQIRSKNPSLPEKNKKLKFTRDIEKLGQKEGDDNFIAVVHIDGNDIGALFKEQFHKNSFIPARSLSQNLATSTMDAFADLMEIIMKDENNCLISPGNDKELPIRPIIIGGDDITFVSHGKFGIYFAEKFMNFFENRTASLSEEPLSACAGVAITKTKYPFFRAYKIAEQLCDNAKKKRKETGDKGCWLDFHIIEAAKTGSVDEVRATHYETQQGKLYMKPYSLSSSASYHHSFPALKEKALELKLPNNKIMELAQVLYENESEQKKLLEHIKYRGYDLPLYEDTKNKNSEKSLFLQTEETSETCFLDMIELLEFYPEELLKTGKEDS